MASKVNIMYILAALFVVSSVFVVGNDANFNTRAAERNAERTFIMVTPGGVQRGLIGDIVHRFEKRGYKMIAGKMMTTTEDLFRVHYASHQTSPFYDDLLKLFSSVPVFVMVWEGKDIVKQGRAMLFGDDHLNPMPGTIRGDYSVDNHRKVCHGSDSVEEANMEIELFFKTEEIMNYTLCTEQYLYEYLV